MDLNALFGYSGVLLGFLGAVFGIGVLAVGLLGHRDRLLEVGRVHAWVILAGALLAVGAMEHGLITHDFRILFIADNNSRVTPLLYTITGLWSALSGSLLLWAFILAIYVVTVAHHFRHRSEDPLVGWAMLVMFVVAAFFFALLVFPANPFKTLPAHAVPVNGAGPNVLLQDNPLVLFHPPMLYAGFVGFTVPFSFALASLITGRLGEGWLVETRRWTLIAWGCLTVGIVLGAWWSYNVLGWGGFWAWDPVENVALLPWLCGTAYLHSVVGQERRGLLRVWNLALIISAFNLTILGTFLDRSGIIESVHAFSVSNLGPVLIAFFGVVVAVSVGLIAWRGDRLRSPVGIDHPVSREGAFLLNNVAFGAFAFIVLLGTLFPLLVEAVAHHQVTVGRPYFNEMTLPIALVILLTMGIAPVLPWRKAAPGVLARRLRVPALVGVAVIVALAAAGLHSIGPLLGMGLAAFAGTTALRQIVLSVRAEARREAGWSKVRAGASQMLGRSNGGMVVHFGLVVLAVGFTAATAFGQRGQVTLRPGQSAHFAGQTLSYEGIATLHTPSHSAIEALVSVDHSAPFRPAISRYGPSPIGVGTPAIDTTITHDVYLTVVDLPKTPKGPATIGVVVQPGILWLWIGAGIMALGTLLALFPTRKRRGPVPPRASDAIDSSHGGPGGSEGEGGSHSREGSDRPRVAELVG